MSWYLEVLRNYAEFSGRARRAEYWYSALANTIVVVALIALDFVTGIYPILTGLYAFAVFIPSLAVAVRRLHDTGRTGWWTLIAFTVVGAILLLVLYVHDSDSQANAYGPDPKALA